MYLALSNVFALKILVLMLSAPIWIPFVKELWREFQLAMREDGGLFGPIPPPRKVREIREQIEQEPSPQIHILKGHLKMRKRTGEAPMARPQGGPQAGQRGPRRMGR